MKNYPLNKAPLYITFRELVEDIAKKYGTSARAVIEENSLDNTLIKQDRKIIIPMVR